MATIPMLDVFNPRFLVTIAVAAAGAWGLNGIFPGAGVALALGIALIWMTRTSVFNAIAKLLGDFRRFINA